MSDIVFIQLPLWGIGVPPLGTALLKSYLKQHGVTSTIFDVNIHAYSIRGERFEDYWDVKNGWNHVSSEEKMVEFYNKYRALFSFYIDKIEKINPRIVGLTIYYSNMILSKIFIEELKSKCPLIKIILGGPHATEFSKDELLSSPSVDAVSLGEGEKAILAYYNEVLNEKNESLPGIAYKKNNSVIEAKPIEYIKNLDDLPFPDFDDFNLSLYFTGRYVYLPSYISRGCINKCIYCTERSFMKQFRFRSAKRVVDEFEYFLKKYPAVKGIRMCDSITNASIPMLNEFCDLMIEKKIPLSWSMENAAIRKEMRTPLYKKLKKADCTLIGYGMETPSEKLLKNIGKTLAQGVDIEKVLKEGKKSGIHISVNIMFGLPGETDEDFENLLNFLKKNRKSLSMVNPSLNLCAFFPGSLGYSTPEKYEVDMTHGPDFWKTIDNKNNFPIRMNRFEKFILEAKKNKLDNFLNATEIPNKNQRLFEYYCAVEDKENALKYYNLISEKDLTGEYTKLYNKLNGDNSSNDLTYVVSNFIQSLNSKERDVAIRQSLSWLISEYEKKGIFLENTWSKDIHPIKARIRDLIHRAIGIHYIEKRINGVLEILKIANRQE